MTTEARPASHDILVVGASAGGVEALQALVAGLPADLPAAVFVVLHLSPDSISVLSRILDRAGPLRAVTAEDGAVIRHGRIYVAPPDRHIMLTEGRVRVVAGPKENRHRPSLDPLFRTAARVYGARVIGVILTGSGDDGTAGLREIKARGGIAVVQHPKDALSPEMPLSALEFAQVDHCVPLQEIPKLLARLVGEAPPAGAEEEGTAAMAASHRRPYPSPGPPADAEEQPLPGPMDGFTCPHCNGHLWEVEESDGFLRYRCRVGHVLGADSLLAEKDVALESTLWAAVNEFQEGAALSRRMAERAAERGQDLVVRRLVGRAEDSERHASVLLEVLASFATTISTREEDLAVRDAIEEHSATPLEVTGRGEAA
jgi:two-component system chemotaxis response regulator CheB